MPSLLDIRRRIRSVKNTQQITKAMKMVAAARMRRAVERVTAARPYARSLSLLLGDLAERSAGHAQPLLARREERSALVLVVTGDKGLCGAFNSTILRAAEHFLETKAAAEVPVRLVTIGRKGCDHFGRRSWPILARYPGIFANVRRSSAAEIARLVTAEFVGELDDAGMPVAPACDAVYVIYNEFKSIIQQDLRIEKLLPVDPEEAIEERAAAATKVDYVYEPSADELLREILPRRLEFELFRILLESAAAEHGARMTAMESATRNAGEMIDTLTLNYNRARQARITKEIIEVVSGAASA